MRPKAVRGAAAAGSASPGVAATAGDTVRLSVERIVPGGEGLARHEGLAVFVPLSAPGDELTARVTEARPGFLRAEPLELLVPGPGRVEPPCPYYGRCGGCDLQHLSYEAQLEAKLGLARDAWRRSGGLEGVDFTIEASEPFGYRNRAQFHACPGGFLGFSRRNSDEALPLTSCPVLAPTLRAWLEARGGAPGSGRFTAFGNGERVFVEGVDPVAEATVAGRTFRFDTGGFFQSNLALAAVLAPSVAEGLEGESGADLYCGVGLFAAFLKGRCSRLTCVEQNASAVGHACANVGPGASFAATSLEAWTRSPQARRRYDFVVADPPRAGLSREVREWLAAARPGVVSYVSCDPVSLARDAGFLAAHGYEVEFARLYDFYPQTSHLESHVRFRLG